MLVVEKMRFELDDIVKALGVKPTGVSAETGFAGVSTDSRTVKSGELFFAIKGEKFDGHDFIQQAIENGATGVVVSSDYQSSDIAVFKVEDTLYSLGELASLVRGYYDFKCAAITGSNGKTTTKEILSACVQSKYQTFKTLGNYNNLIGLPLSLFQLEGSYEAAVFELGMSVPGEINRLAEICRPQIGIFTNVAPVHLEYLGSIEAVAKAKYELIGGLPSDGTVVLNADDKILSSWVSSLTQKVITYGIESNSDYKVESYKFNTDGTSEFVLNGQRFMINFPGLHNIYNAACALAASSAFGLSLSELSDVLSKIRPYNLRSEIIQQNGITIINDCYNANPTSMKAAIDVLASYPAEGRKVAVIGDMLELGRDEVKYHIEIGEYLQANSIDSLFAFGKLAEGFGENFRGEYKKYYSSKAVLIDDLKKYLQPGDVALIKASHSIALEQVTEALMRVS